MKKSLLFWLVLSSTAIAPAFSQTTSGGDAGAVKKAGSAAPVESATLTIWNRQIVTFRAPVGNLTPRERVQAAAKRFESLPYSALRGAVTAQLAKVGELEGMMVLVDSHLAFAILREDLDPESTDTLATVGAKAAERFREVLRAQADQQSLPLLLRGIGLSVLATLVLVVALWVVMWVRRRVLRRLETARHLARARISDLDLRPQVLAIERSSIGLIIWIPWAEALHIWITYVFGRFPYTEPWGDALRTYLFSSVKTVAGGVIDAAPGIGMVVIIYFVTRFFARLIRGLFYTVETGALAVSWLHPETARATRRLVVVLTWLFALSIAYPYILGSNTDAFKGLSVFVGIMISLGASGMVNQIMSGFLVVYSRAVRTGEYVRIGEVEGVVSELGVLSTRIATRRKEEITIPNSVLVSSTTTNYSRLAGNDGAIVGTCVTIGYDSPWRQIHALLLLAAERTPLVKKEPKPRVLQKALSDFFVEYHLLFHIDRPEDRVPILSDLHAQIQDAFNEFGVQIMSPHFEAQPGDRVWVPRPKWHEAPATGPSSRGDNEPDSANHP